MTVSNIKEIISDLHDPIPWDEGDNIPWNEPSFSKRMLNEHLTQTHDLASRRFQIIDQHVNWIHSDLLKGRPCDILDICCGPGFYTERFARLGHKCLGIDYSPASIEYARQQLEDKNLDCEYILEDVREADFDRGHDLAALIFGEFNVFKKDHIKQILSKAYYSLKPSGLIILEVHTFDAVKKIGMSRSAWQALEKGLFQDSPHIFLEQSYWDPETQTTTKRFSVIETPGFKVKKYALSCQAYTESEYIDLVESVGFCNVRFASKPNFEHKEEFADDLQFIIAQKPDN